MGKLTLQARVRHQIDRPRHFWSDLFRLLRLLRVAGPWLVLSYVAIAVSGVAVPIAIMFLTGAIVNRISLTLAGGLGSPPGHQLVAILVVLALVMIIFSVLQALASPIAFRASRRIDGVVRKRVGDTVSAPFGIGHLEDPAYLDALGVAAGRGGVSLPGTAAVAVVDYFAMFGRAMGSAAVLASFSFALAAALFAMVWWLRRRFHDYFRRVPRAYRAAQPDLRHADYTWSVATRPASAKEVRVFGMQSWATNRFRFQFFEAMADIWRTRSATFWNLIPIMIVAGLAFGCAYALVARSAAQGAISVGLLAVYFQAAFGIGSFGGNAPADWSLAEGRTYLEALAAVSSNVEQDLAAAGTVRAETLPVQGISFEGVRFAYPGSNRPVFDGLDLHIPAGESLAIVGLNGAGKTTLIKLLARLYDPQGGRIVVDGIDLRDLDGPSWRRRLAVLFQDFVKYELSVSDNVALGASERRHEREGLQRAAALAGLQGIIDRLPKGWDAILSRAYSDGVDISGGEWQRVALARAMFALEIGASVLILDEPTANLDVRAEADMFERFLEITKGWTSVIISHRFSTVRRASRIIVLENGRVLEEGSHEDLLASGGRYAELFRFQASRFKDADEHVSLPDA